MICLYNLALLFKASTIGAPGHILTVKMGGISVTKIIGKMREKKFIYICTL